MRFLRPNKGIVNFSYPVIALMNEQRQLDAVATEAGGMLLGRLISETDDVIVDEATEPTNADRRGRFFFDRSRVAAQQYINLVWERSARTRIYLGEWHTHPEDDPSPSPQDLKNWRRITRTAQYEQEHLIFAIVGRKNTRVWECDKHSRAVCELGFASECKRSRG